MATRKALTVNQQIDALLKRQANPARKTPAKKSARSVVLVAAKNPRKAAKNPVRPTVTDRKKQLPDFRYLVQIEGTSGTNDWFSEAAFRLLSRAEDYAKALHRAHPKAGIRVLARD